jgi:hypothetical protein
MLDDINLDEFGGLQGVLDDLFADLPETDVEAADLSPDLPELVLPMGGAFADSIPDELPSAHGLGTVDAFSLPEEASAADPFLAMVDRPETMHAIPHALRLPNPFLDDTSA